MQNEKSKKAELLTYSIIEENKEEEIFQRAALTFYKTEINDPFSLMRPQVISALEPAKPSPMLSTSLTPPETGKQYTLYSFRWVMQAFFTVSTIVSGFLMVGFSPISETIAKIYDCSQIIVQLQTLLFLIAFIPGNFIVIWVLNKYGLRATVSGNFPPIGVNTIPYRL